MIYPAWTKKKGIYPAWTRWRIIPVITELVSYIPDYIKSITFLIETKVIMLLKEYKNVKI